MIDNSVIDNIRHHWRDVYPQDMHGGIICPICGSGSGKNGTGISSVKGEHDLLKCLACGFVGDVIQLYCAEHHLDPKADFVRAVEDLARIVGVPFLSSELPQPKPERKSAHDDEPEYDFSAFLDEASKHIDDTDYWQRRGLSRDTCTHFNVGFDPHWIHPKNAEKGLKADKYFSPRLIIPATSAGYLARDVRDNADKKYSKQHAGNLRLFNADALDSDIVFVVEGEFDAMSVFEVGFTNVVGLCSISQTGHFCKVVKEREHKPKAVIISLDNEDSPQVKTALEKLTKQLKKLGIATLNGTSIAGDFKDANELLCADRERLKSNCQALLDIAKTLEPPKPRTKKDAPVLRVDKPKARFTRDSVPDCPVNFIVPEDFSFTPLGIFADGDPCCKCPVVPLKFYKHHVTQNERFVLAFKQKGEWKELITDARTIADHHAIVELSNRGIRTDSGTHAKQLVQFLQTMIFENDDNIPLIEEFDRPGWSSDLKEFRLPYAGNYYMPDLEGMYEARGDLSKWLSRMKELCDSNFFVRLSFSAALAAPLLRLLGQRTFGLYLYGTSRAGKSAANKFALSMWGHPDELMTGFNGTQNGLEAAISRANDLLLLVDDSANKNKNLDTESLQYFFSSEKSRQRMDRKLKARPNQRWRSVVLMNGEGRLFNDATQAGALNRVLEVALGMNERVFGDEVEASDIHHFVERNHGVFGKDFLEQLTAHSEHDYDIVNRYYSAIFDNLQRFSPDYTLEYIKIISVLGGAYALFLDWYNDASVKPDGDQGSWALARAVRELCEPLFERVPKEEEMKDYVRAWAILVDYIDSHINKFLGEHLADIDTKLGSEIFGQIDYEFKWIEGKRLKVVKTVYIDPTNAKKILKAEGFSPDKILRDFRSVGYILSDDNGQNPRIMWQLTGTRKRMVTIPGDKFNQHNPAPITAFNPRFSS